MFVLKQIIRYVRVFGFCSPKDVAELIFCLYCGDVGVQFGIEGNVEWEKFVKEMIGSFVEDVVVVEVIGVGTVVVVGVVVSAAFYPSSNWNEDR
jgi:hypothetical protein